MFNWLSKTYRNILESMTDGVYLVDMKGIIRYGNGAAETLTGLSADKMIGSPHNDLSYTDEKGIALQSFEYPVALCFQKKKTVSKQLYKAGDKGKVLMLEEIASPLMEKGEIAGVIATVRDISSRVEIVEARLKSEKKERLIPICGWCKKIRSDENYWEQLESYLTNEGFGIFTHGMCPSCAEKIFEKKVYLESFQNICKAISASISIDEVLHLIVTNVVKVMNVKASLLRLLNRETQQLEIAAYYGLSEKYANKGPVGYDKSIDDALAGEPASVYDITEHEDSTYYEEAKAEGIRSILSIPVRADKEVIGILRMYTAEPVNYTADDLKFMSAIAEQGAIAIINARRFEAAVSNEKEYLRVFEEITKTLSSSLDLNEVLDMIVRKIREVMGLKGCTLRLLNKEKKQLELAAHFGLSEKYVKKGPVAYDASIDDARAGKAVSEYDISAHKESKYYKEAMEEGIKNILSVPMIYQNEIMGMLRFYTAHQKKYNEADLRFMEGIAEQAAIAIVKAKHFEKEITKEKEYLEVFQDVTKALSVSLKPQEVFDMIVRKLPEVMNLKAATVRLLDKEGKNLELVASYGLSDAYLKKGPVDAEKNVIEALTEKAVAIYDVATDDRVQYKKESQEEGIKSMLTLPIMARGKVIGILRLLTAKNRKFSQQEIDFTASLAEQSGIAILNAQSFEQEISREKEYLRVFEEITKTISSSLDVKEVLNMIVRKIPEVMGLKGGMLRLINKEKKQLELVAYHGLSEQYASKGPVSYDASLAPALPSSTVSVYDIAEDKESKYYKEAVQEGIWSIMSVPLSFQSEIIGRLRLYSTKPINYTDEDARFMSAIAEQTAIAIVNAKHFEKQISKEKEYLEVFEEVTKAVSASLQPGDVIQMIVKKIPEVMDLKAATIRLLDPSGKKLKLAAAYGLSEQYLGRGPIDAEKNVIQALKEKPVAIYDVSSDNRIQYQQEAIKEGIKSMLTVPVIARGKVLGILRLLTGEPRKFSDQEIHFVTSLAEQCATAIANALMYEKIKKDYDEIMKYMDGAVCKLE